MQGDIVAIYNSSGSRIYTYEYDAWGNVIRSTSTDSAAYIVGYYNPFRYRGYYYDTESGLYYLNSRYYNPQWGRFLSADSADVIAATPTDLTDKNLFAYCDNNPITRKDDGGEFWHIIAGGLVGGIVSGAVSAMTQFLTTGEVDLKEVGISAVAGALSGALAATGFGVVAQAAGNALISGAESLTNQVLDSENEKIDYRDVALSAAIGGVLSRKKVLPKGEAKHLMTQGLTATKKLKQKGIIKTAKYYFSQTKKLYYKPLVKDSAKEFIFGTSKGYLDYQFDRLCERYLYA